MINNKCKDADFLDKILFFAVIAFIVTIAIISKDSYPALISSICGIVYTFLAGKGLPVCYIFGVIGSSFYSYISLQNLLWGNLFLYAGYYIPMQILGFFKWKQNLKDKKKDIIKIRLPKQEMNILLFFLVILWVIVFILLLKCKDNNPVLDSITTVLSIGGMYLTVRRAIEQWIFWFIVNLLSLIMWICVVANGTKVYSTVIMWAVYLFLSIHFYIIWNKEIK